MPSTKAVMKLDVVPLPGTTEGLKALRTMKTNRHLIEYVDDLVISSLWENEHFRVLCGAVLNSEAEEGSLNANHFAAAEMIRTAARKEGGSNPAATATLESLKKSLRWVLRRYNAHPKQRLAAYLAKETQSKLEHDDSGGC